MKVGPTQEPDDLLRILDVLNPANEPGRITLISRMGADKVAREAAAAAARGASAAGRKVVWLCDPMHGNTISTVAKLKTRNFDSILSEVRGFFDIHAAEGTWAGGVHVEMTGQDVTECIGGAHRLTEADLTERYETFCDPRLNAEQSLELAFLVAEELKQRARWRTAQCRRSAQSGRAQRAPPSPCGRGRGRGARCLYAHPSPQPPPARGGASHADHARSTARYRRADRQLLQPHPADRRAVRRQARHLCGVPAPAGDLGAAADDRMAGSGRGDRAARRSTST